ncbi:hypothetical protein G6F56_013279 [Rhizopus delemar]|nr:hypothetical protein G6F56_013279 [Rhizopus delemar]
MLVSGHSKASTVVLRHICNLPSMSFRAETLLLKYCQRSQLLPDDSLLSLLSVSVHSPHLDQLRQRQIVKDCPADVCSPQQLSSWLRRYRQKQFESFLAATPQKLIKACRPVLRVDPILYLPASRVDQSRLVRWRMGWIPGEPIQCSCHLGLTSRSHLMVCSKIPSSLWSSLPFPPSSFTGHHIDYIINMLPTSAAAPCPPYWPVLCSILLAFDKLCHPDIDYSSPSPPGQLWLEKTSATKSS